MATSNTTASSSSQNGPSSTSNTSASETSSLRVAEARRALEASMNNIGSSMTTELSARAQNLHANSKALDKQQLQLEKETAKLKKENDKLAKEAEKGAKALKELGNVQNWAEVLERDFLVLRETLRLAREGSEGSWSGSDSGSWTEEEDRAGGMEVLVENWEEDVDGDGFDGPPDMVRDADGDVASSTEPCKLCGDGERDGQVLLCDGCAAAYHLYCLGLHMAPEGTWFCSMCKGKGRDDMDQMINQMEALLRRGILPNSSVNKEPDSGPQTTIEATDEGLEKQVDAPAPVITIIPEQNGSQLEGKESQALPHAPEALGQPREQLSEVEEALTADNKSSQQDSHNDEPIALQNGDNEDRGVSFLAAGKPGQSSSDAGPVGLQENIDMSTSLSLSTTQHEAALPDQCQDQNKRIGETPSLAGVNSEQTASGVEPVGLQTEASRPDQVSAPAAETDKQTANTTEESVEGRG